MYEDPATAGASSAEVVEELLRQLVDARFVLTDREGSVTRWSRPAEELFGWPAPRMLGRPLADTLRLDGELPQNGGQVETTAIRKDRYELEVALTLVPVSMSHSLEFNGFLEALEIAAPRGDALAQLQRSHQTVVEWIHAAVAGQAHVEDDVLSAGTIVAFRALGAPPPPLPSEADARVEGAPPPAGRADDIERALEQTAAELAQARAEAGVARTEAAARLVDLEQAGAGLQSGLDEARRALDELRAQVDSLREGVEQSRAEGAQRAQAEGERLSVELEAVRTAVEGIRRDVAGAPEVQERLREQVEQTRSQVGALEAALAQEPGLPDWVEEVQTRMERIESERIEERERFERAEAEFAKQRARFEADFAEQRGRLEAELAADQAATRAQLEALEQTLAERGRTEAEITMQAELAELRAGAAEGASHSELLAVAQEVREAADAVQATRSAAERLVQGAEEAAELARDHSSEAAQAAGALADRVERAEQAFEAQVGRAAASAERADQASGTAEGHAGRAGEHARSADTAVQRVAAAVEGAERRAEQAEQAAAAAAEAAARARRSAEEAGIDAAAARRALEREDGYDVLEPLQAGGNGVHRPLFERPPESDPSREPRPGFDDVSAPMATIGLDGHFRELNQAFTELVGYREAEFGAATWPPVMDHANLPKHRKQMAQMLAGAIQSAEVNTGYVHAQGLLVPVAGRISLVKQDDEPDHFLLEVQS